MAAGAAVRRGPKTCLAGVRGEEVGIEVEGCAVRLWRATGLEEWIDAEALLRAEAAPEPPYWMHLWPGALAAARLLGRDAGVGRGGRVLELGCGLALPALVAARRGAAVVATDREREPLQFVRRSAAASRCAVHAVQMDWTTPALGVRFDVCVGADVGYDLNAEAPLAAALARLVAPGGVAWLTDSVNTARDGLAVRLAAAGFAVEVRATRESEDGRPVWVRIIEARRRA